MILIKQEIPTQYHARNAKPGLRKRLKKNHKHISQLQYLCLVLTLLKTIDGHYRYHLSECCVHRRTIVGYMLDDVRSLAGTAFHRVEMNKNNQINCTFMSLLLQYKYVARENTL